MFSAIKTFAIRSVYCLLPLLFVLSVSAQVPPPAATDDTVINYQPRYSITAGAGFNKYSFPQSQGFLNFAVAVSDKNFTYTSLVMTSLSSSLSQGFGRYLIQTNGFTLASICDAGIAAGNASVAMDLGGGGVLAYDISKHTKIANTQAVAILKVDKTAGTDVKPTFLFGISLGLGKR